jgi:hypothetical protein
MPIGRKIGESRNFAAWHRSAEIKLAMCGYSTVMTPADFTGLRITFIIVSLILAFAGMFSQHAGICLLVALLLLSSAFFCGEISHILHRRAKANLLDDPDAISTPGLNRLPARQWPLALLSAFASPAGVAAVVLWLFGVIVNLIR